MKLSCLSLQINDFLSGCSPLNINLGIGAHVMCVELQLSAQDVKELLLDSKAHGSNAQTASSTNHPHSSSWWTSTTGPATTSASQASSATPFSVDALSSFQFNTQGARTSLNSQNPSVPSSSIPATNSYNPSSLLNSHSEHGSPHAPSPPLPCGSPHPGSPLRATAPVCSAGPISSSPAPLSPTAASTFTEVSHTHSQKSVPSTLTRNHIFTSLFEFKLVRKEYFITQTYSLRWIFVPYRVMLMLHPLHSCPILQELS